MEALKMCGDCMDCCYYKLVSADWCHFEICYKDHNEDSRFNELNLTRCEDYRENRLIRYYYHHIYNGLLDFKRRVYYLFHPFKKRKMDKEHEEIKAYMEEKRRKREEEKRL